MYYKKISQSLDKKIEELKVREEKLLEDIIELYKIEQKYSAPGKVSGILRYETKEGNQIEIRKAPTDMSGQLEEVIIYKEKPETTAQSYPGSLFPMIRTPIQLEKYVATIKTPLHKKIKLTIEVIQQIYKPYLTALEEMKKQLEQEITQHEKEIQKI